MFTSREFNTFIRVAEKMSIKLAAQDLNITPPAVCSMIKKLERRIDNKLFIFENNKMILTKYGERIYSLTESHFHTLKSLEVKMKRNKEIIKIFLIPEYLFLSPFITNRFKMISIEIILTSIIDDSTDIIIDNKTHSNLPFPYYNLIVSHLSFYLAHDKKNTCNDIYIHKDHAHLINHYTLEEEINKPNLEGRTDEKTIVLSNVATLIDMVISSLGCAIFPHTCSVLKCLFYSKFELSIDKLDANLPVFIYVHNRIDPGIINDIFDENG